MTTTDTYLLAEGVLLCLDDSVIVVEGLLQFRSRNTNLLRKRLAALKPLHQTTADVVLAVPLNLLGRSAVQDKAYGILIEGRRQRWVSVLLAEANITLPFSHIFPVT